MDRCARCGWLGFLGLLIFLHASTAAAVSFALDVEFDDGITGDYGMVDVTENGTGGLDFEITINPLDPLLGPNADLQKLYFNLVGDFTGLAISDDDAPYRPYRLFGPDPPVRGGAGSSFDWKVAFGNGAGRRGNGTLQFASFTLTANEALTVADMLELSSTKQGIEIFVAARVQNTTHGSETVGDAPEPGTALLLAAGLLVIASRRRR